MFEQFSLHLHPKMLASLNFLLAYHLSTSRELLFSNLACLVAIVWAIFFLFSMQLHFALELHLKSIDDHFTAAGLITVLSVPP
jgi:hypothetical protein